MLMAPAGAAAASNAAAQVAARTILRMLSSFKKWWLGAAERIWSASSVATV
jgi:hypothetical protein